MSFASTGQLHLTSSVELLSFQPSSSSPHAHTRECIIPDISRTYHFGASGLNMNPYFQVRLLHTSSALVLFQDLLHLKILIAHWYAKTEGVAWGRG